MPSQSYSQFHYFYLNVDEVPNTDEGKAKQLSDKPGTIYAIINFDSNTRANLIGTLRDDDENGVLNDEKEICDIHDSTETPVGLNIPFDKLRLVYKAPGSAADTEITLSSAILHKMFIWKDNEF